MRFRKGGRPKPGGKPPTPPPRRPGSIKYEELFGTLSSLGAGLSSNIIDYTIPDGHGAELYAVGIQPDFDPTTETSNLLDTEIAYDGKATGIRFLTNHVGKNALPYGDRASLQPMRLLDFPMRRGNLTSKFNEGMKLQVKVTAGAAAVAKTVNARAKVLLYEEADAMATYGVPISALATLPGGVSQAMPTILFADYVLNYATTVLSKWEDAYSLPVKDYEQIILSHIGVCPHLHADAMKLYDHRQKWEAPEYEPYWKIGDVINALPFGDDADHQPTQKLPSIVAGHVFTNTDLKVQARDDGVAAATISLQLLGTYRRVR